METKKQKHIFETIAYVSAKAMHEAGTMDMELPDSMDFAANVLRGVGLQLVGIDEKGELTLDLYHALSPDEKNTIETVANYSALLNSFAKQIREKETK